MTWCYCRIFLTLQCLVTGSNFMTISLLVLELRQFSFIRDWPEILKSEILSSEFCQISGDWDKFGIPNLAQMSLTFSELLSENQQRDSNYTPPPPQILGYIKNIAWIKHYYQAATLGKCLVGVWPWILSFSLMCLWHTSYPQI